MRTSIPIALLAATPLLASGCRFAAPAPRNVLLITVDTLRADHLGYHGYHRNTSPFLDSLARKSHVFLAASVQVPKTFPSIVSMMTSQYPERSGVTANYFTLDEEALTLAEVVQGEGFQTIAYTTNGNLVPERGIAQGFETFHFGDEDAKALTERAVKRLEEGFDHPFFLWLHYVDPHGPYTPPEPYSTLFVDDAHYDARATVGWDYTVGPGISNENYVLGAVPRYQQVYRDRVRRTQRDYYVAQYDGEIRYLDDQLRRLFTYLDESELSEETVVVFTADHGEGMGEHDYYFEHGWFVYEDQVHVPLLIHLPGGEARAPIEAPVQLLGLGPTLLELAEVPVPASFQGRSLAPLLNGERAGTRLVYFRTPEGYPHRYRGLRLQAWKYVESRRGRYELYNLRVDPAEQMNLALDESSKARFMRELLSEQPWETSGDERDRFAPSTLGEQVRENLRTLGYIP